MMTSHDDTLSCPFVGLLHVPADATRLPSLQQCKSLSRITFANGSCLKRIEERAFSGCKSLQEIEIPASVEVLGERCFGGIKDSNGKVVFCESLSRVTFASGSCLKRIEKGAFGWCESLQDIEIPAGVSCDRDIGLRVRMR